MNITRLIFILSTLCLVVMPRMAGAQNVPEEARRYLARGLAAVEMAKSPEDYGSAIREFQEAARVAPNWPDPHYNLGLIQERNGSFREAAASFSEYLRLAPKASDAAQIQQRIYKLQYRAEQTLSVPEIINVMESFQQWQREGECRWTWAELVLRREGDDSVKAMESFRYYPDRQYYQTLRVTGPVLRYQTVVNVCDATANSQLGGCDSVLENTVEVISRNRVQVNQKVRRGGDGAGVATGQVLQCTFRKN